MSSKIRALIGLLVSAIVIWVLIRRGDIDWSKSWEIIRGSNKALLALSSAAATAIFALRAARWRVILPPPPAGHPPLRFSSLFEGCIIGQMATNIIPGRAGEIARPLALARMEKDAPFATGVASVFIDRVFDGIVVLVLLLVAMLDPAFPHDATIRGRPVETIALLGAGGLSVGLIGLFILVKFPELFIRTAGNIARLLHRRLEDPVAKFLRRFADGLGVLRDPRRLVLVFAWTVAHWLLCAASYWLGYKAVGLDAPLTSTLFVQTIIVLVVAIPAAPGFIGVFELTAIAALGVYGVPHDMAAAWAVVYHVVSYIPVTVLGLVYSFRLGMTIGDINRAEAADA